MRQHQAVSRLQTDELFNLLNDKLWYSFSPSFLCKKLSCTDSQLKHRIFALRTLGIQVNEFVWNERPFIGLESRRIQYEKDKVNGTNHVEHLIKQGAYSQLEDLSWGYCGVQPPIGCFLFFVFFFEIIKKIYIFSLSDGHFFFLIL